MNIDALWNQNMYFYIYKGVFVAKRLFLIFNDMINAFHLGCAS